ncbi:MAG: anaerobic glycerol-3-phosphate dehydrogenase subunit GlpA [Sporolactobacillus sp.]
MGQKIKTEVAVIGGGITGVGILRDLALRGIQAILIEKGDLGHGTSTRNHGLLHSGGRYAVRDPKAAIESCQENWILKKTFPGSIEATDGLFVKVPGDDDSYVEKWVAACRKLRIPAEEIPVEQVLREEPYVNRDIQAAYRVPDGAVDDFTLLNDAAEDAENRGAKVMTYHEATSLLMDGDRVAGVRIRDTLTGEKTTIEADLVINASGPWGTKIAEMAGIPLHLVNNKGMLVVFSHRISQRVINRLRVPGDGDIFVPSHDVTIFGTTGINVNDPEDVSLNQEEMEDMLEEGKALIPGIHDMRLIRAYSGSRPLYQAGGEVGGSSGRNVKRGMALIDHRTRDGIGGLVTITGGKLTTFRLMAERTVDLVCEKLGKHVACTTKEETVWRREPQSKFHGIDLAPAAKHKLVQWSGTAGEQIESSLRAGEKRLVICECEQVTWAETESVLANCHGFQLGDIRRRTRLGMGPCQGTFCNFRATAMAVEEGRATIDEANQALRSAIDERKSGMTVVATGETARQLCLMQAIYQVSLGIREEVQEHV